jgi:ABC-type uncharacterized transport system involved in gliding motility auxiliary subunit
VTSVSLGDSVVLADTGIRTLIIAGQPDSLRRAARQGLQQFFARGGSALIMTTGAPIDGTEPRARAREPVWNEILKPFGVKVRPDLVYDLSSNQLVPVPGGQGVFQPYPFWVRARGVGNSVVTDGVGEVFLPWVSSIDTIGAAPGTVTPLLISSRAGAVAEGDIDLSPTRSFPPVDLKIRVLGVSVQPAQGGAGPRGRLVVVGNMEFATDRYLGGAPDNATLALNAIDWLAQDEALISIRSRDRRPPRLLYASRALQEGVKYANLALLPVLIAVWGVLRLTGRRRRALEPWRPLSGSTPEAA